MTYSQIKAKIEAARQLTAANQDKHRIHLERGYVYASEKEVFSIVGKSIVGYVTKYYKLAPITEDGKKQFWALDSKSRLVMI